MKWFIKYWAKVAGFMAMVIVIYLLISDMRLSDTQALLWLHFVTLLIHQFEEYVYPGGFKKFFNNNIYNKNLIIRFPLNDRGIILVNVVLAWSAYLISAVNGEKMLWLAVGLLGVTILNGIMHTFMFLLKRKYNPGFLSGLLLLIPFGIYVLLKLKTDASSEIIMSGLFVFIMGVLLIPMSIYVSNKINHVGID